MQRDREKGIERKREKYEKAAFKKRHRSSPQRKR